MAAGSIFAGLFNESYNSEDTHTIVGILISFGVSLLIIFCLKSPFQGLLWSQLLLSMQLPFTVFLQVWLTSSPKVMGKYANTLPNKIYLYLLGTIVTVLNLWLLVDALF